MANRLPVSTFDLPLAELRRGYRSASYFGKTKKILEKNNHQVATMQVFQKGNSVLCGIDEALAILKTSTGHWKDTAKAEYLFDDYMDLKEAVRRNRSHNDHELVFHNLTNLIAIERELDNLWVNTFNELEVHALHDGDEISPWESVMFIKGDLSSFVHLESVYLGVLARRTKVATNVRNVVKAANGKPILFFADRFDHFGTQGGDGYAAHIGGATGVASPAMGRWWGEEALGTMPHALIAAYGGDVVSACIAYHDMFPNQNLIALVDFNNDCVKDSLAVLAEFGSTLWGVRLDTSENMVDVSVAQTKMGDFKPTGVNPRLVHNVRTALDDNGGEHVKIIVSGGFNVAKITEFETNNVKADSYAVGSSLLQGSIDFTADVVIPTSKEGRWYRPSFSTSMDLVT